MWNKGDWLVVIGGAFNKEGEIREVSFFIASEKLYSNCGGIRKVAGSSGSVPEIASKVLATISTEFQEFLETSFLLSRTAV